MQPWHKMLVQRGTPILEAIQLIDQNSMGIASIVLVVDEAGVLEGTVTDGDVRRAIIAGQPLDTPVERIMNVDPVAVQASATREQVLTLMTSRGIRHIPRVDAEWRVMGLEVLDELLQQERRDNLVIIMAGGCGTRLRPLTNETPKPLLKVGNKPILETILDSFIEHGFHRFYLSVNYKAEMLEAYFGDGARWGIEIRYLREERTLGTAGSLSLLPEIPDRPLIVMNADLLTRINFAHLLDFHAEQGGEATICVREHDFTIPFGVVRLEENRFMGIEEKPVHRVWVNTGIYVLEPQILSLVPQGERFDMPDLFQRLIERCTRTAAFPIREYWLDIGHLEDLERANGEYCRFFP